MELDGIGSLDIQRFYNVTQTADGPHSVLMVHKILRPFFTYCIRARLLAYNPIDAVTLPRDRTPRSEKPIYTEAELGKIVDSLPEHPKYFIYVFLAFTGLRIGEALALTLSDVQGGVIRVTKSIRWLTLDGAYQPLITTAKTAAGCRDIPIMQALQPLLASHIEALGSTYNPGGLLFPTDSGGYRERRNVQRALDRMLTALGIDADGRNLHLFRHTFCTMLARYDVPITTAQRLMGHSNIQMTAAIYSHASMADKRRAVDSLGAVISH
jgi:integrase